MLLAMLPSVSARTTEAPPWTAGAQALPPEAHETLRLAQPYVVRTAVPSLGELLQQGKNNLQAPWLGFTGFFIIALMLSLLIFIGEAVRDAFDPRKLPGGSKA